MIGWEEVSEVLEEVTDNLGYQQDEAPALFKEQFEAFGMEFNPIATELKAILGRDAAAIWICGMYMGLALAAKYWEYRVPPKE